MDAMIPLWPDTVPVQEVAFSPYLPSKSGGPTLAGDEEVIMSSSGKWVARMTLLVGHGVSDTRFQDAVLAFRAMLAKNQGKANSFLIGPQDQGNSPAAVAGTDYGGDTLHSDDAEFSDSSDYDQAETPAHVASNAAQGAVTLDVMMEAGHAPEPGQYFGLKDRLYLIQNVTETETENRYTLTFWPVLRAAALINDNVNFDDPVCRMKFADDRTGEMSVRALYQGSPTIELTEADVAVA